MKNFVIFLMLCGSVIGYDYDICQDRQYGTFLKDYSSCKSYIACSHSYSIFGDCPEDLLFNEANGMCDYPENVKCSVCPPTGLKSFGVDGSCDTFVRCINGVGQYLKCSQGLYFDKQIGSCNIKDQVDCVQNICANGNGFVESHEDCRSYYECNNGIAKPKECRQGQYFNPAIRQCDRKENVQCSIRDAKEEDVNDIDIICPPTGIHFYPHPIHCSHYFICLNGVSAPMYCGSVLHYDYIEQKCVLPQNAKCIRNVI